MSLTRGTRVGRYEIVGPLGAGGMGEVYRAHDTQLRRDVAIKVLHEAAGTDRDRLRRFEQEALATAALNHPNILAIFDVGVHDDQPFVVSELLEGRTLRETLSAGALTVRKAVAFALQIAQGLGAAHEKGIVHRDLKPENLLVTNDDRIKILDFGLARMVRESPVAGVDVAGNVATRSLDGVVVGTVGYMAPEQVRGETVDHRADIFSFGAVFYEMLTRRRAFHRDSVPGTLTAILDADPPSWDGDGSTLSLRALRLIHRCLEKAPGARFQSARDLALVLADEGTDTAQTAVARRGPRRWWPSMVLAATAAGLVIAAYLLGHAGVATPPPNRYVYDVSLPAGTKWWAGTALSPDAKRLAIVTQPPPSKEGVPDPRLWIRDLTSGADWQLVSGGGQVISMYPFWSPDGRSLAFFRRPAPNQPGKLVRLDLPSLVPVEICDAPDGRGGVWLADGTIVFAPTTSSGLYRVNSQGGAATLLIDRAGSEVGLKYPTSAGAGRVIYFVQDSTPANSELRLLRLDDPAHAAPIVKTDAAGGYDSGTLFYRRGGVWIGQAFDPASGRLTGEGEPVPVDSPGINANIGAGSVVAAVGHVVVGNVRREQRQATWVSRSGAVLGTLASPASQERPAISPDGKHVALSRFDAADRPSLWIIDAETGASRLLIADATAAVWHADGVRLAVQRSTGIGGNRNTYEVRTDDERAVKPLLEVPFRADPVGWIGGSDRVVVNTWSTPGSPESAAPRGILILEPGGKPTIFRRGDDELTPALSPDGTRIAFVTLLNGEKELLVDRFPTPASRPIRVAHGAVIRPQWRGDGRELFFVQDGRLMAARVSDEPALSVSPAAPLFALPSTEYAVDRAGDRFLVLTTTSPESSSVKVTLNWRGVR